MGGNERPRKPKVWFCVMDVLASRVGRRSRALTALSEEQKEKNMGCLDALASLVGGVGDAEVRNEAGQEQAEPWEARGAEGEEAEKCTTVRVHMDVSS